MDCLHIAQQLVDKQFILPIKLPKVKPFKFMDDDTVLYYFAVCNHFPFLSVYLHSLLDGSCWIH